MYNFYPCIGEWAFVQESATILGDVYVSAETYIGNNTIVWGDLNSVKIAYKVVIKDNCVLNTTHWS